jgi:hypothetical protein
VNANNLWRREQYGVFLRDLGTSLDLHTAKAVAHPGEAAFQCRKASFPHGKAMLQIAYFGGQRQASSAEQFKTDFFVAAPTFPGTVPV